MVAARKKQSGSMSVPLSVIWGSVAAIIISLVTSGILAFLVNGDRIKEANMGVGAVVILFIASCSGGVISARLAKERVAVLCAITSAAIAMIMLAVNILIFNADFSDFVIKILAIVIGGVAATLLSVGKGRKKRHR